MEKVTRKEMKKIRKGKEEKKKDAETYFQVSIKYVNYPRYL